MTSKYAWIITHDCLDTREVKITGPSAAPDDLITKLEKGEGRAFEIRDDDNELYYRGRYIGPDDEDMFGPLDDYGTPNAGATSIWYWINGKKQQL